MRGRPRRTREGGERASERVADMEYMDSESPRKRFDDIRGLLPSARPSRLLDAASERQGVSNVAISLGN